MTPSRKGRLCQDVTRVEQDPTLGNVIDSRTHSSHNHRRKGDTGCLSDTLRVSLIPRRLIHDLASPAGQGRNCRRRCCAALSRRASRDPVQRMVADACVGQRWTGSRQCAATVSGTGRTDNGTRPIECTHGRRSTLSAWTAGTASCVPPRCATNRSQIEACVKTTTSRELSVSMQCVCVCVCVCVMDTRMGK
jgi:hypothetical protein